MAVNKCCGGDVLDDFVLTLLPSIMFQCQNGMSPILVSFHCLGYFPLNHDYGRKGTVLVLLSANIILPQHDTTTAGRFLAIVGSQTAGN